MRSARTAAFAVAVLVVAGGVALALGAPRWLGVPVAVAGAGSLALTTALVTRADRDRVEADIVVGRLRNQLSTVDKARLDAEAKLGWRMQLTAMRRSSEADSLIDKETGLPSEGWFVVALESRLAAARRNLAPIAVVMFEVVEGLADDRPRPTDPTMVADAVRATLRESDGAFRLRDGGFALVLDDSSDLGALWSIERIRNAVVAEAAGATIWAGVACYPAHGMTVDELLDQVDHALDAAREWRQDRIEVAPAES